MYRAYAVDWARPGYTRPETFSRKQWLKRAGSRHYKLKTTYMRSRLRRQLSKFMKTVIPDSAAEGGGSEAYDFKHHLQQWRDAYTVAQAQDDCTNVKDAYSCGIFSSGGCLDTLAAIRCGFIPKWGTEICETKQRLWKAMTKTASLGDTFKTDFNDESKRIIYLSRFRDTERDGTRWDQ